MRKHIQIRMKGDVKNKGLRFQALREAHQYNISGWVAELSDSLRIEAEGEEANIEAFVERCRKGLDYKVAITMEISEKPLLFFDRFLIL